MPRDKEAFVTHARFCILYPPFPNTHNFLNGFPYAFLLNYESERRHSDLNEANWTKLFFFLLLSSYGDLLVQYENVIKYIKRIKNLISVE